MTLIDGDNIVTIREYDDEYEEFTEKKMSIIDFVNTYTDEGSVTTADDVLDKIKDEIRKKMNFNSFNEGYVLYDDIIRILDKYMAEESDKE